MPTQTLLLNMCPYGHDTRKTLIHEISNSKSICWISNHSNTILIYIYIYIYIYILVYHLYIKEGKRRFESVA